MFQCHESVAVENVEGMDSGREKRRRLHGPSSSSSQQSRGGCRTVGQSR